MRVHGYTLIELISVVALATLLISLSVGGYHLWVRDTAIDAAQSQVKGSLARARAYALAHNCETRLVAYADGYADYTQIVLDYRHDIHDAWQPFTATNRLPRYIYLKTGARYSGGAAEDEISAIFNGDGTLAKSEREDSAALQDDPFYVRLTLFHVPDGYGGNRAKFDVQRQLDISRLTGLVRDVPPGEGL